MEKIKLSLIATSLLITSANAIDITQFPKLFDDNGTDLIEEFDLDPRIFSTLLGGIKISDSAMKDGLGLFVYVPTNKDQRYINQNSLETYYELIDGYDDNGTLEEYIGIIPIDPEIEELIDNGLIRFPIRPPASNELIILPNGTVTCFGATPGNILDDGNGNKYYVVDNTLIWNFNTADMTYSVGSAVFDMAHICTTNITNMDYLFAPAGEGGSSLFTVDIDISNWDVSNVTSMAFTFDSVVNNIGDISQWNVSNVTNMFGTFIGSNFNQDISNWNVSNVTNISSMFAYSQFNQPIGNWNVSNVIRMSSIFNSSPFNQDISNWNVSNVTDMYGAFDSSLFNQDISNWDVSNVVRISLMFNNSVFNQPIGNWNVSNVTDMSLMFANSPFNQDISNWNTSNVITMSNMFANSSFNQPIGNWDVSNVINVERMFADNTVFDQDISGWNVSNVLFKTDFDLNTNANWTAAEKPTFP